MAGDTTALITGILGVVCGGIGAVLGVINTVHQLQRNKVRLKVTPQYIIPVGGISEMPVNYGIEVLNLSDFPVVITDVGFTLAGKRWGTLGPVEGFENNGSLPLRLEPRNAYSKYFRVSPDMLNWTDVRGVYARTQCGEVITGTSGSLKQLIQNGGRISG